MIILFCLISPAIYSQDEVLSQKTDRPGTIHTFSFNPLRVYINELSIFYERQTKPNKSIGFSIGFIYPTKILQGGFLSGWDAIYNAKIRLGSNGLVSRLFYKFHFPERKYISLLVQIRYLHTEGYNHLHGYTLESNTVTVNLDRSTLINGWQIHFGKALSKTSNPFYHEIYGGIGVNWVKNLNTVYNHYTTFGVLENTNVRDEYKLRSYDNGRLNPSIHIGYRLGIRTFKRGIKK